ncbi:MAG: GGDEF domain-containing protein [Coriobacteriia bacterium]|nr:GGDEF domain-containing protein [Coriobacteriia bacterium]
MYDVTAGADEERVSQSIPQTRLTLWSVLLVAATSGFVTAIVMFSGTLSPAWLLFLVPITIGALAYGVAGGLVVTAISLGALYLSAPLPMITDRWSELVTGFAVFLACSMVVGIQSKRQRSHREALEHASSFDPLTGVLKAEHLIARLNEEISRAERYETDLGLVLLHVEDFDEFTRLFGHYKAESMLRHLTDIVRLTVRVSDIVGRLAPTTLAVVLPNASVSDAAAVAARLMRTTREAEFEGDALEPVTACVTSTASTSYPAEARKANDMLGLVRQRLPEAASSSARGEAAGEAS